MKFKVGDEVKLNENIEYFKFGKGGVGYDEIGTIIKIDCHKDITVNFPTLCEWKGAEEELILVNRGNFFKKLPNNFTGTLEVKNGYIVEKEILDDIEKEYLKNVIKPFKNRIRYITKRNYNCEKNYIVIHINDGETINFPIFKKETMYKGMEEHKKYTLKELSLDE